MSRSRIALTVALALGFVAAPLVSLYAAEKDAAIERSKREVAMLDDLYKTAVVLVTTHYVTGKESLAAGEAFGHLFKAMKDKKWHEVRLIDATGGPINAANSPADDFEKEAIKAMLDGKPSPEQVVERDGKRYYRTLTPVPVVMEKCIMCHENYRGKKGIIGALGYTMPVVE